VHATCEAYTRDVPYIGWRDPLRQLLGLSWEDPDDVVIGRLRNELKSSQPELLPWLPLLAIVIDAEVRSTRAVDDLSDEHRTEKLHEIVLQFLEPALEVPTLVQIEHAHLMDDASGALLHALSGRLESSGWIVIVTRRDVETGFVARDGAVKLDLGPMSREDAMALAEATPEAQQLPPHVLELAVERSGGSPEFLIDLLAAAVDGSGTLPDSVDSAASARIDALDPGDRALVRRVSVLGLSFHAERVRDVIEPAAPEPDEATWERLAGVFAVDPDGHVRFKRPAQRDVAYHSLPFKLRRELHAAVGTSLERDQGRDVDADPAVLSLHFILAGDHERAWRYALEGAKRAEVRFAHADAARLYRRAIEAGRHYGAQVAELAGVWESLGVALHKTGELSEATHAIATARRVSAGDPIAQGRLFYRHARIAEHSARLATAVRWAFRGLRALEGLRERDAVVWRAKTLGRLVFYRTRQGRMREAERLCHRAIAESQVAGELDARAYAYYMLDWALSEQGRREEARYSARALEIYVRLGDLEQQANVLNNLAAFAFYEWRWDEALELFRQSADCSRRAGIHNGVATAAVNIGDLLTDRGLYQEAASHLTRARRLWSATGERAGTAHATGLLGRLAVRQGRHREGLDLLHQAVEELRSLGEYGYVEFAEALLAEAETFGGDPGRALAIADRLIGAADRNLPLLYRIRATALAQLGRDGASEALATSLAAARERDALYDIAAALKLADSLLGPDSASARERDAILDRLGVQLLPAPPLATFTQYETSSAAVG
jgi:tetratricopeptide (TPR) repeat protein